MRVLISSWMRTVGTVLIALAPLFFLMTVAAQGQPPQGRGGPFDSLTLAQGKQPPTGNQSPQQPANQTAPQPTNQTPAQPQAPPPLKLDTKYITSKDGTRIAYDVTGKGPHLILLHGAGQSRREWHEQKYVDQLSVGSTVITIDMRGHGESDKPTAQDAYALDRMIEDIVGVADAAGAQRFNLWGYGYGATIGRYVALRTDRVRSMVYIGMGWGPALDGPAKAAIEGLSKKWKHIIDAQREAKVNPKSLAEPYRSAMEGGIPVTVAKMGAMINYPPVEPTEIKVPTLWLVGSDDPEAMAAVKAYEGKLAGTPITVKIVDNINHAQEFYKVEAVLPIMLEFTVKQK